MSPPLKRPGTPRVPAGALRHATDLDSGLSKSVARDESGSRNSDSTRTDRFGMQCGSPSPPCLSLSLRHPAKSSQKCVSCIWEGVALRVPPPNTKEATWTGAPRSAELVPTWCQTALIQADSRASVPMAHPSLMVLIDHCGCSQVGFRSDSSSWKCGDGIAGRLHFHATRGLRRPSLDACNRRPPR